MAPVESTHFETLQLHAGFVLCHFFPALSMQGWLDSVDDRHEPDSATNARAVPIYATTVSLLVLEEFMILRTKDDVYRASHSMTLLTELGYLASRSLEIFTVVLRTYVSPKLYHTSFILPESRRKVVEIWHLISWKLATSVMKVGISILRNWHFFVQNWRLIELHCQVQHQDFSWLGTSQLSRFSKSGLQLWRVDEER